MLFQDRTDAGRQLGAALQEYRNARDTVVLALPRGGVSVGFEVARALDLPLDVWVVRKAGTPGQPELGLGAVSEGGTVLTNRNVLWSTGISLDTFQRLAQDEMEEVRRRVARYRSNRTPATLKGKTVLLVDDGIATGASLRVAAHAIRQKEPARLVVAVPVSSMDALEILRKEADEVICLHPQPDLWAVGAWYRNFKPLEDDQVCLLLEMARRSREGSVLPPPLPSTTRHRAHAGLAGEDLSIEVNGASLSATLSVPERPAGVVLFAHGVGGGRHSARNRFVARALEEAGFATLLIDLLTGLEEERDLETEGHRHDIRLLAGRVLGAGAWVQAQPELGHLPLGLFGGGAGGAAALIASAIRPDWIGAVVCRGGRPDLAGTYLDRVSAPTLLLVGERDPAIVSLNHSAYERLWCTKELTIVPGATHHFEEPRALEEVARASRAWFADKLRPGATRDAAPSLSA